MSDRIIDIINTMPLAEDQQWMRDDPAVWQRLLGQCAGAPVCILPDMSTPALICGVVCEGRRAELWMVRGQDFRGRVIGKVLRQQRALCAMIYQSLNLSEMMVSVWPEFDAGKRWAARLGFAYDRLVPSKEHNGKNVQIWVYQNEQKECKNGFS